MKHHVISGDGAAQEWQRVDWPFEPTNKVETWIKNFGSAKVYVHPTWMTEKDTAGQWNWVVCPGGGFWFTIVYGKAVLGGTDTQKLPMAIVDINGAKNYCDGIFKKYL